MTLRRSLRPNRHAVGALLAVLTVASSGTAQTQDFYGNPLRSTVGPRHAVLDLSTGELRPSGGATSPDKVAAKAPCYVNTDWGGFYCTGRRDKLDEWLDWGIMQPTSNGIVCSFTFGYATTQLDMTAGGPGAELCLSFYDGAVGFCSDSGMQPTAAFSFTGLPGASTGLPMGFGASWIIEVDLSGGFEFRKPAGPFGFSIQGGGDDGSGRAQTGPLLCYVGDGSGGPDNNGGIGAFDIWIPDLRGICSGTFFTQCHGLCCIESWYLRLEVVDETASTEASATLRNAGANPASYTATAPVIGQTFVATVDLTQTGHAFAAVLGYATPLTFPLGGGQVLLVNLADPGGELMQLPPGPGTGPNGEYIATFAVPPDVTLCGKLVHSQGVHVGGVEPFALTNALDLLCGF